MESVFDVLQYLGYGLLGLFVLLVLVVLIFGKRVRKQWEYEAEFRDASGREFGELDIEMSRIEQEEPDYTLKVSFRMRHETLRLHQTIQVTLDGVVILEGMVGEEGSIRLGNEHLQTHIDEPHAGQVCKVIRSGEALFSAEILPH